MNKQAIREYILKKVHGVPISDRNALEHVLNNGIRNYISFNFEIFKEKELDFVQKMMQDPYQYKYAASAKGPCLYASIYACMIYGLLKRKLSETEKEAWKLYFDSFQKEEDGLFYPPELACTEYNSDGIWGDGWGKRHLAGHILIAYNHLGEKPKYRFSCFDSLYNMDNFETWKKRFSFGANAWSESNYIMNAYSVLQYNRDYWDDKKAGIIVEAMKDWLKSTQNKKTGLWNKGELSKRDETLVAIRAAYHLFPLFVYDGDSSIYIEKTIDYILASQNNWGGFTKERSISGACEDIDAIDPLIRLAQKYPDYRKAEIEIALKRSLIWILSNFNEDGGATFYIENEHHYGDHPMTSSGYNESNMFATWFRTLCVAYMCKYLKIPNEFKISNNPGYEMSFER